MAPVTIDTRNISATEWSHAAIQSTIERGGLQAWRDMFAAGTSNPEIARRILDVARIPEGTDLSQISPPEALAAALAPLKFPVVGSGRPPNCSE